ncbi:hypothetical protein KR009_009293 [Drosophila setifemur]|nr:hypothetical protein KR009_009293 [Drosophila setifemur]
MAELMLFVLMRFLLPLTLIFVSLLRPVGISLVYLSMFFISPWLLQSQNQKQRTLLRAYIMFLCGVNTIFLLGHVLFNLTSLFFIDLSLYNSVAYIFRQIGFLYFKGLSFGSVAYWMLPDIIVLLNTIVFLIFLKISDKKRKRVLQGEQTVNKNKEPNSTLRAAEMNRLLIIVYIQSFLKTCKLMNIKNSNVLYFAACLRPSIPGGLYFLMFIIAGTYWAMYRQLNRGMYYLLIFMVVALLINILCIFGYQFSIFRRLINPKTIWTRIMGMEVLLRLSDDNNNEQIVELNKELNIDSYLSPIALMLAYFVSTLSLISRAQYEQTFKSIPINLDPKSKDFATGQPKKEKTAKLLVDTQPSLLEQFFYMVFDITSFIYKNSYLLLNIIMMIWSIVYHSWLTFVLLIWANILWMIPNQRRSMMRSSFFVVLYAEFLLIAQYIYGMRIYEDELPTKVTSFGFNLEQIGFVHPHNKGSQPWMPLTVKTGFLFVFWITSRQYFIEKAEDRTENDLLQQIFGPHHSRSEHFLFEKSQAPQLIIFIFKSASNFITRIWMWLLIFLIFLCAMIDSAMTGFRICYMSLFLLFLMVFQMSLQLWIRFLYGYWMFLIFYAMTILTVIYTYQFDNFDVYWETFLTVHPTLQNDIGLRRYQTKDLFLHLLIPTLTVIFTVVQLHYFHRRFMDSVRQPKPTEGLRNDSEISFNVKRSQRNIFSTHRQSWKVFFSAGYKKIRSKSRRLFRPGKIISWGFLEMHMIKAVILASFLCAISEVCFFNVFIVAMSLLSVCVNRFLRRAIFRIGKNIVNFAEWVGLRKTGPVFGVHLRYISPYIIYMIVTSLHAVVKLRDHLIRYTFFEPKDRHLLFPDVKRRDAERDFPGLLKYMLNYGFFKFGLEITLIGLVATIAHRRDLLSLTYVIWLILLLVLKRVQCARIWEIFQLYFVLSIFVQYLYLLSFPPNLCVAPINQSSDLYNNENVWILLDESQKSYYKAMLMLDFIVLLLISRQRKSFKAEIRTLNDPSYPGGDNASVVYNIAKLGHVFFENPTHDFCSYVRNYADVFKTAVFCSFFWITLGVVFMGGVCSMDVLSLGYIIFALVFLLQGSEVYLQNIHYIICRWNCLIAFNIFNIILKAAIFVGWESIKSPLLYNLLSLMHQEAILEDTFSKRDGGLFEPTGNRYHYGPNSMIFKNTLVWHAIIFAFVIFQHRIFRSYYFCHVIMDTQANTILASRGAAIIENLHYKQIYDRREYEKNVLESVKAKMERIRATNLKNFKRKLYFYYTL